MVGVIVTMQTAFKQGLVPAPLATLRADGIQGWVLEPRAFSRFRFLVWVSLGFQSRY